MDYGRRIRQLRDASGITQGALAEKIGQRQKDLCYQETGQRQMSETQFDVARTALLALVAERNLAWQQALSLEPTS